MPAKILISNDTLLNIYRDTNGNYNSTAIRLKISRQTLYNIISSRPELKDELRKIKKEAKETKKKTYEVTKYLIPASEKGKLITDKIKKILEETRGRHIQIFDLAVDQLSLRDLMDTAKIEYNRKREEISLKDYIYIMVNLHKTYAIVTKTAEEIAIRKLEGKTPTQFYDEAYNFFRTVFETFKELINDERIDRGDIIREFCERIDWQIED